MCIIVTCKWIVKSNNLATCSSLSINKVLIFPLRLSGQDGIMPGFNADGIVKLSDGNKLSNT